MQLGSLDVVVHIPLNKEYPVKHDKQTPVELSLVLHNGLIAVQFLLLGSI
jgi:hypothetical protein